MAILSPPDLFCHITFKFVPYFFYLVNGNFSEWSEWSNCSKICGIGRQNRYRSCTSPPPQGEGENCNGNLTETRSCNITLFCPGKANIFYS